MSGEWVLACFHFACAAVMAAPAAVAADVRNLSDADLVAYASKPFDKAAMMEQTVTLGRHHGVPVVAEFPCSDVCPAYTIRIIHYDVPPGPPCDEVGGVTVMRLVPYGIATREEPFCTPKPIAGG
jgi:hypothetical protein